MKKRILDLYTEIEKRTARPEDSAIIPHGIFYYLIDGGIHTVGEYSWETAPDVSDFSDNLFFGIKEEPPGMENLNYTITVYDYNSKREADVYRMYFKPGTGHGQYTDEAREALKIIRGILDDIAEEIITGKLSLV